MYEQVFGLTGQPFTSTPFVNNYFAGESIHHALAQTRMSVERASGPVIVTGTPGTGKSLLLAMLADQLKNSFQVATLVCGNMNQRQDLLQAILFELQLPYRGLSEGELRLSLLDHLKSFDQSSNGILLLVDEAHNLLSELLDELRLITNFAKDGRSVVSLVLAGMPNLEDHLIETKSESFNQRIAARCYLTNLGRDETYDYVITHIERAGGNGEHLFTSDALSEIHSASEGCPRIINQICDYALVLAASQNAARVTAEIVNDAWRDVQSIPGADASHSRSLTETTFTSAGKTPETAGDSESDDMMVIEFGVLDSDITDTDTVDVHSNETELTICSIDESTNDANATEYNLQATEETFDRVSDTEIKQGNSNLNVVSATSVENVPSVKDVQGEGDSNIIDHAPADVFDDPFAETFEEVELVKASFFPTVSEHNLNALMLTTEQLARLDSVPTSTDFPPMSATTPIQTDWSPSIQQQPVDDISVEAAIENDEELKLSSEGLAALDQVEADIKQLQRDLRFSEQEFSSKAVHPDFELSDVNEPLEELTQQFPVVESDTTLDDAATVQSEQFQKLDHANVADDASDTIEPDRDDDRDIITITNRDRFPNFSNDSDHNEYIDENKISTGYAQRMDYLELFRQLRNAE